MFLIKKIKYALLCVLVAAVAGPGPAYGLELPRLAIISPADGTPIAPGQTIKIVVKADPGIDTAMIVVQRPLVAPKDTQTSMTYLLTIPLKTPEGTYRIKAISEVEGQLVESGGINLKVRWPRDPVSVLVDPVKVSLPSLGKNESLKVIGTFADGSVLDITYDKRTIYTSANPLIATVSPDGMVSSLSEGDTVVKVQNGKSICSVPVSARSGRINRLDFSTAMSVMPIRRDADGNLATVLVVGNQSSVPLSAIAVTKVTLNGKPALRLPPLKKGFELKEQWSFPVVFPASAADPDKKDATGEMVVEGMFSVTPEGYYDPKDFKYDVDVALP